jgi:hypothetical protein
VKQAPAIAIAKTSEDRLSHVQTKALPKIQNDAARRFIEAVIKKDFADNLTKAADAFGVAQSTISDFLAGNRGAGMKLLSGVSAHTKQPIEVILGGAQRPERVVDYGDRYQNRNAAIVWARADGLSEAAIERVRGESLSSDEDPHPRDWYRRIEDAAREIRREELGLPQDAEKAKAAAERDRLRVEEMKELTKPKLPKRKR